jgi:Zn-dependent protease with chaperone function
MQTPNLMKIHFRQPRRTADISAAQGTALSELWKLILSAVVLLVGLYFLWGIFVDAVVARISYATEAKIFKYLEPHQPETSDPAALDRLKTAEAILKKLQTGRGVPPLPFRLVLMDQAAPNAFAIPGGSIGVTRGLLDVLTDDIEIAFVIGHELGHFKNRDHLQGLGRAAGYSLMAAVLFDVGAGSESFGDIVHFVMERSYSQEREKKADRFGLGLVYAAYGRVQGTERLFKLLLDNHSLPNWAYMFSTHPSPKSRILALKSYGDQLMQSKNR